MTPVHWAAFNGHPECLRILILAGANLKARDCVGLTPLHRAARGGRVECLKILLENGCDADAINKAGKTALHEAANQSHEGCLKLLLLWKAYLSTDGPGYTFLSPTKDLLDNSKSILKSLLLCTRYAGSIDNGIKLENPPGEEIVPNDYVKAWPCSLMIV